MRRSWRGGQGAEFRATPTQGGTGWIRRRGCKRRVVSERLLSHTGRQDPGQPHHGQGPSAMRGPPRDTFQSESPRVNWRLKIMKINALQSGGSTRECLQSPGRGSTLRRREGGRRLLLRKKGQTMRTPPSPPPPPRAQTLNGAERDFRAVVMTMPSEITGNMFITNKKIGYWSRK